MADPPAPSSGGFSLTKKYGPLPAWGWGLLGGGAIYAGYRFYQNRQANAAATATTTAGTGQAIDYGPELATIEAEIQQLQQGENSEGSTKSTGGGGSTKPTGGSKKMPDVVGERANFAIGELKSGYGVLATTVPPRDPKKEYTVTSQTPKAGATVRPGSRAVLRVKVDQSKKGHKPPRRTKGPDQPGGHGHGPLGGSGPPVTSGAAV